MSNESRLKIDNYVEKLKGIVPPMEHGAIESRLEELLNDASAGGEDVIATLRQEFDPPIN